MGVGGCTCGYGQIHAIACVWSEDNLSVGPCLLPTYSETGSFVVCWQCCMCQTIWLSSLRGLSGPSPLISL